MRWKPRSISCSRLARSGSSSASSAWPGKPARSCGITAPRLKISPRPSWRRDSKAATFRSWPVPSRNSECWWPLAEGTCAFRRTFTTTSRIWRFSTALSSACSSTGASAVGWRTELRESYDMAGRILNADLRRAVKGSSLRHDDRSSFRRRDGCVQIVYLYKEEGGAFAHQLGDPGIPHVLLRAGIALVHQLHAAFLQHREA